MKTSLDGGIGLSFRSSRTPGARSAARPPAAGFNRGQVVRQSRWRQVCSAASGLGASPVDQNGLPVATGSQAPSGSEDVGEGMVKFGFPKGSLQKSTEDLFGRAGFRLKISERSYFPQIDDDQLWLLLLRSQEISRFVEDGVLDAGICGHDWIVENGSDVVEVCELQYSKATSSPARWVLAVEENSDVQTVKDLEGQIVASELVKTTERFFKDRGVNIKVEYSWGATEVKARIPGIGGIVDITETGSSLKANKLRIIDTILSSTTRLVANKSAWEDKVKRQKIEDLAVLLQGAILGRRKVGLKMNLPTSKLDAISSILPSALSPTVSTLVDCEYVAVEVVVEERAARSIITECRRCGASGILTYSLNTIVPDLDLARS
ncbi:unnamed protein product [Ostreobium quekettii]|uniref:ATP phosphoribosyltransferase n=1 Tax=Ostreobium quekettii TaxID=121088 RepID=A0A8S1IK32_9CHLO|nr:unnamed protein product [Ostreobium quekettii]